MCSGLTWIFFFNDTATTEIYTLSLHDALPISDVGEVARSHGPRERGAVGTDGLGEDLHPRRVDRLVIHDAAGVDRKSTRLNSSHANISYAVFCLKKKKKKTRVNKTDHYCLMCS